MKYLARISYDGSKFQGFQRLNNGLGVQNEIEKVLSKVNGSIVKIVGAGRTDAGVHAKDQCIHFDLQRDISLDKLKYIMNRMLSPYVSVNTLEVVKNDFHARYSVKEKTYLYKVYLGEKNVFLEDYAYCFYNKLDLEDMKQCSKLFIGTYDFRNFVSGKRDNYMSIINEFQIFQEGEFLFFELKGKSFYRYMVRSIVGAVMSVGVGKAKISDIESALKEPLKKKQFLVAPPNGLYLTEIKY